MIHNRTIRARIRETGKTGADRSFARGGPKLQWSAPAWVNHCLDGGSDQDGSLTDVPAEKTAPGPGL